MTDIKVQNQFFVYLLECTDKSTYVGATVDLQHRLRQHNKEIKGGAHATTMKVNQGHSWKRICYIKGFPDWTAALQFEWAFKFYSRKFAKNMPPLMRRMRGLHTIMHMERPTSKAIPYYEYNNGFDDDDDDDVHGSNPGPKIVWESDQAKTMYLDL